MTQHTGNDSKEAEPASVLRRRSMIAGVGALAAGLVAAKAAQPVGANNGDVMLIGGANNNVTLETALAGKVDANSRLLHLSNGGTGSALEAYGDGGGIGVLGYSTGKDGVSGQSNTADGIHAGVTGGANPGGNGVLGECNGATNSYGVWGKSDVGIGVRGQAASSGMGVFGSSPTGTAVFGNSTSGTGAQGMSTNGFGVYGASTNFIGVYGQTSASGSYGVLGLTTAPNSIGLTGIANGDGASAFSGGTVNPKAYAAIFQGTVVVQGKLIVSDPSYKSGALAHPDGTHRLVYCVESPESWIEDVGKGAITGGKGEVRFDADFAAVTHTDDYRVFLTPEGDSKGLYVTNKTASGFSVHEQQGGTSALAFAWRVMVKGKSSVKQERLAKFTMPNLPLPDPAKFPKAPAPPPAKK